MSTVGINAVWTSLSHVPYQVNEDGLAGSFTRFKPYRTSVRSVRSTDTGANLEVLVQVLQQGPDKERP